MSSQPEQSGQPTIIEEKITKVGSDPIIKKYSLGKLLGKGGFAKCYEVTNLENKKVMAAKVILKSSLTKSRAKQKLISEIKIHKSLRHQNVVGFEHVFEDQDNVYILLELCTNQSMHDLIKRRKRLTEIEVQCYTVQLISALKYLHSRRVIHRDLKLGNFFLNDKMELKVGDFGLAARLEFDGEKRRTVCGTPNYIAPEVIEGKGGHSYEVDTWSLGVIIYTLLVGKPPFETPDVKLTYKKIKTCTYSFPENVTVSDNARSLITKMLSLDPSKRPTLDEIYQHPFIRNGQNIPKLLPTSTLSCPPSSSYLNQYANPDNSSKIAFQPLKTADNTPLNSQKGSRTLSIQKNNLVGSDKCLTSPQSPTIVTQVANENVNSLAHLERQASEKGSSLARGSHWQTTGISSAQTLKSSARPHTVQQRDLKSNQGVRSGQTLVNLGSNLRLSGAVTGSSRGSLSTSHNDVWVKKWVDYSTKYGMGYILSNGAPGVFFNDNTKIVLDIKTLKFDYIDRTANDKQDTISTYSMTEFPKELQKKVTLLQHFRNYLEGTDKTGIEIEQERDGPNIYVKKWIKTKNATLFRLSNKVVQVNFADKTEIILNSDDKLVTYVNKKGERSNYPLNVAMESSGTEMAKRLKYTKELLTTMINGSQPSQIPTLQLQ